MFNPFFSPSCWTYRLKFYSLHICYKTCSKGRIAHFFSCGRSHCNIHPNTDLSDFRPAWSHPAIVKPTWMVPAFQTMRLHQNHSDTSKMMLWLFSHFPPSAFCQSDLQGHTGKRNHSSYVGITQTLLELLYAWFTQVLYMIRSPDITTGDLTWTVSSALGHQKCFLRFNKPWNSLIHHVES